MSKATDDQKAAFFNKSEALARFFKDGVRDQGYVLHAMQAVINAKPLDLGHGVYYDPDGAIRVNMKINYDLTIQDLVRQVREFGFTVEAIDREDIYKVPIPVLRGVHEVTARIFRPVPANEHWDSVRVDSALENTGRAFDLHHLVAMLDYRHELTMVGIRRLFARGCEIPCPRYELHPAYFPFLSFGAPGLALQLGSCKTYSDDWFGQSSLGLQAASKPIATE